MQQATSLNQTPTPSTTPTAAQSILDTEPYILRDDNQGITTLTLNRPQQYNVLSLDMLTMLSTMLTDIAQDDSVRVVVLAANGKAFCSGHNLKQMQDNPNYDYQHHLFTTCSGVMQQIRQLPQPVIAKVQGIATAAGCQLVASCDLAVAADTAMFATSGIRVGLFCSTPAVAVSRSLPTKKAFELLVTGEFMSADEALNSGFVNQVTSIHELDAATQTMAQHIITKSPLAITIGKRMFYQQLTMPIDEAYEFASQTMADNMMADDAKEGIDAFISKRQPTWTGR